jgi:hypothetical protein
MRNGKRVLGKSYVYFLQCGGFVKIGVSARPTSRLLALSASGPHEVRLLLMLEGGRALEKARCPNRHTGSSRGFGTVSCLSCESGIYRTFAALRSKRTSRS